MRVFAGILGVVGAVISIAMAGGALFVGGLLVGMSPNARSDSGANPMEVGSILGAGGVLMLALSICLIANRIPRTASLVLVALGLASILIEGWLSAFAIAGGLVGYISTLMPRPSRSVGHDTPSVA